MAANRTLPIPAVKYDHGGYRCIFANSELAFINKGCEEEGEADASRAKDKEPTPKLAAARPAGAYRTNRRNDSEVRSALANASMRTQLCEPDKANVEFGALFQLIAKTGSVMRHGTNRMAAILTILLDIKIGRIAL